MTAQNSPVPGDVVLARSRYYAGKLQPWVLLSESGSSWSAVRLTQESRYSNGDPRVEVPHPTSCGLRAGRSFLWAQRAQTLSRLDIISVLGHADHDLLAILAEVEK